MPLYFHSCNKYEDCRSDIDRYIRLGIMSGNTSLYDRQMKWKKSRMQQTTKEVTQVEGHTFQPHIHTSKDTNNKYKVNERARELTVASGSRHIERQQHAREVKEENEKKILGQYKKGKEKQKGKHDASSNACGDGYIHHMSGNQNYPNSSLNINVSANEAKGGGNDEESNLDTPNNNNDTSREEEKEDNKDVPPLPSSQISSPLASFKLPDDQYTDLPKAFDTELNMDEVSIVQLLERERQSWHAERLQLAQCIHLQQRELQERSSAAQETAAMIAKEFARAIETFEKRILTMESSVEKEVKGIREIAEDLRSIVQSQKEEKGGQEVS